MLLCVVVGFNFFFKKYLSRNYLDQEALADIEDVHVATVVPEVVRARVQEITEDAIVAVTADVVAPEADHVLETIEDVIVQGQPIDLLDEAVLDPDHATIGQSQERPMEISVSIREVDHVKVPENVAMEMLMAQEKVARHEKLTKLWQLWHLKMRLMEIMRISIVEATRDPGLDQDPDPDRPDQVIAENVVDHPNLIQKNTIQPMTMIILSTAIT